jgi:hypothetical protein
VPQRLRAEHGVVRRPGGVNGGGQRMLNGHWPEFLQRFSVRRVAASIRPRRTAFGHRFDREKRAKHGPCG